VGGSLRVPLMLVAALVLLGTRAALLPAPGALELPRPALPALLTAQAAGAFESQIGTGSTSASAEIPSAPICSGFRIAVPRLEIDLPIAEGDITRDTLDQRTPEGFAFHLPGTALPGQSGNTYLYAHARQGMFLALWNVRLGDEVVIFSPDGQVLVFVVREILPRVSPTDVSSTQPTTMERLTLQTSTGPSPADPRFVVFAFRRGDDR
jgi:LPXTG-site transpeptidase (sortase) family protein